MSHHFECDDTIEENIFFKRLSVDISGELRDPIEWLWFHAKDTKTGRGNIQITLYNKLDIFFLSSGEPSLPGSILSLSKNRYVWTKMGRNKN